MPCLSQQALRRLLTLAMLTLLCATLALAQEATASPGPLVIKPTTNEWAGIPGLVQRNDRIIVVTTVEPARRHMCRVQSVDASQLVCFSHIGKPHVYPSQQVAALILQGDHYHPPHSVFGWIVFALGGANVSGAVFLASASIAGAVSLAVVGGFLMFVAPILEDIDAAPDGIPDALLYLAPGQTLQVKLRY